MDFNHQKQITIVSDIKFVLTRLDPAREGVLIDLLNDQINRFQQTSENFEPLLKDSISEIKKCLSDNKIEPLMEINELIESFTAFLPK